MLIERKVRWKCSCGKVSKKTWGENYGEYAGIPAARRALRAHQKTCKKGRTGRVVKC